VAEERHHPPLTLQQAAIVHGTPPAARSSLYPKCRFVARYCWRISESTVAHHQAPHDRAEPICAQASADTPIAPLGLASDRRCTRLFLPLQGHAHLGYRSTQLFHVSSEIAHLIAQMRQVGRGRRCLHEETSF